MPKMPSIPVFASPIKICSKIFGAIPLNSKLEYSHLSSTFTWIVLIANVLHLYFLPKIFFRIERLCTSHVGLTYSHVIKILYASVVFGTSLISKLSCIFVTSSHLVEYYKSTKLADELCPASENDRKLHWKFSLTVVLAILTITVPINLIRLEIFYGRSDGWESVLLFANMYFQNLSTAFSELQFTSLAFALYLRFKIVNERLRNLLDNYDRGMCRKYNTGFDVCCSNLSKNKVDNEKRNCVKEGLKERFDQEEEEERGEGGEEEMMISVRVLFEVYKRLFESCESVKRAYGIQLLVSTCCLWFMLLFDLYMEIFDAIGGNVAKPCLATYIWCAQYLTRFLLMAETSQKVMTEGVKTRYMVSALNNRSLDQNTKEELILFANYISNTKIEFTACDFFTLNTHLITSAIAAGTTYLVILVQFHSDKN